MWYSGENSIENHSYMYMYEKFHSHSNSKLGLQPKGKNAMVGDVEEITFVYLPLASDASQSFS